MKKPGESVSQHVTQIKLLETMGTNPVEKIVKAKDDQSQLQQYNTVPSLEQGNSV